MKILIETTSSLVANEIRQLARRKGAKSFQLKESEMEDYALSRIAKNGLKGKNVTKATVLKSLASTSPS